MSTASILNEGSPGSDVPTPRLPPPGSPHSHGKMTVSTETQTVIEFGSVFTFSPKLCSELLPMLTPDQKSYEVEFQEKTLGQNLGFKSRKPNIDAKTAALSMSMCSQVTEEIARLTFDCKAYRELIFDLSCTVTRAQKYIDQLQTPEQREADSAATPTSPDPVTKDFEFLDTEPVCFLKNFKINRNITDFTPDIDLVREGNRTVAYYGPVDYKYGRVHHRARDYPISEHIDHVFSEISEALGDPEFNKNNYSCLFTLYDDHNSILNYHSDNEVNILPDSKIITVSLGETRCVKFRNIIGPLREEEYPLPHGSVHLMTQQSQTHWQHCIPVSQTPCGPRMSLTFRRHTAALPKPQPPPSIHRPLPTETQDPDPCSTSKPSPKRVLFLTDSIIMNFPIDLFPDNVGCIKKVNFELFNIDKYEHEFSYTDVVVINCGINDLTRHDFTARKLLDFIIPKLNKYTLKYPNVMFIINSLLYTVDPYFNGQISTYNRELFKFSVYNDNVWFFDSHHLVSHGPNPIDHSERGNGVHITHHAKKHISSTLRECIVKTCSGWRDIDRIWPLRPEYRHIAVDIRSRSLH